MGRVVIGPRQAARTRRRPRRWYERTREEVYAYRTTKPWAALGLPIIGRHWGYAGRTNDPKRRDMEHIVGGGRYSAVAKPWADLRPRRFVIFRMKSRTEAMTHFLEWLTIKVLLPVYNVDMNLTNPRRITKKAQAAQRFARDQFGTTARLMSLALRWAVYVALGVGAWLIWGWTR
jgi:hypothetical protein